MGFTFRTYDKAVDKVKNLGELTPDGVFVKQVIRAKHFLRTGNAYGIDKSLFEKLKEMGCKKIMIVEKETGEVWTVSYEIFYLKGWDFKYNRFEMQRFLEKKWWRIVGKDGLIQEGKKVPGVEQNDGQKILI